MKARKVKKLDPAGRWPRTRPGSSRCGSTSSARSSRGAPRGRMVDQHDMRIAAKRLRYVLEATEFCFGRPAGWRGAARRTSRTSWASSTTATRCCRGSSTTSPSCAAPTPTPCVSARGRRATSIPRSRRGRRTAPPTAASRSWRCTSRPAALLFDRFRDFWEEQRGATWERLERAAERGRTLGSAARPERADSAAPALAAAEAGRARGGRARQARAEESAWPGSGGPVRCADEAWRSGGKAGRVAAATRRSGALAGAARPPASGLPARRRARRPVLPAVGERRLRRRLLRPAAPLQPPLGNGCAPARGSWRPSQPGPVVRGSTWTTAGRGSRGSRSTGP